MVYGIWYMGTALGPVDTPLEGEPPKRKTLHLGDLIICHLLEQHYKIGQKISKR